MCVSLVWVMKAGDLSFQRGDVILITKKTDKKADWCVRDASCDLIFPTQVLTPSNMCFLSPGGPARSATALKASSQATTSRSSGDEAASRSCAHRFGQWCSLELLFSFHHLRSLHVPYLSVVSVQMLPAPCNACPALRRPRSVVVVAKSRCIVHSVR